MAQIPYIEHKKRLFKFYQKVRTMRTMLIATNAIWLSVVVALVAWMMTM
jgi:hypothetical protein